MNYFTDEDFQRLAEAVFMIQNLLDAVIVANHTGDDPLEKEMNQQWREINHKLPIEFRQKVVEYEA